MNKHRSDIEGHILDSVQIKAADLMQRFYSQQTRDDGAAVYAQATGLALVIVERLLRDYRVTRKTRTERTVKA